MHKEYKDLEHILTLCFYTFSFHKSFHSYQQRRGPSPLQKGNPRPKLSLLIINKNFNQIIVIWIIILIWIVVSNFYVLINNTQAGVCSTVLSLLLSLVFANYFLTPCFRMNKTGTCPHFLFFSLRSSSGGWLGSLAKVGFWLPSAGCLMTLLHIFVKVHGWAFLVSGMIWSPRAAGTNLGHWAYRGFGPINEIYAILSNEILN